MMASLVQTVSSFSPPSAWQAKNHCHLVIGNWHYSSDEFTSFASIAPIAFLPDFIYIIVKSGLEFKKLSIW